MSKPRQLLSIFEPWTDPAGDPGPMLDLMRRLGVQYVRIPVRWRSIAPEASSPAAPAGFEAGSPSAYPSTNWAPYDTLDREARSRGIRLIFDITGGAPQWASGPGFVAGGAPGVWRPAAGQFGPFVRAVGTRYSGQFTPRGAKSPLPRVSFWSIWNEPNLGEADLAPQATDGSKIETSAVIYRGLLDAGWMGLHQSGHGADTILIGELAPYGQSLGTNVPGTFGEMVPLRFLRALYCVDSTLRPLQGPAAALRGCPTTAAGSRGFAGDHPALFEASGLAIHPYPSGAVPPDVVLPGEPDFLNLASVSRVTNMLDQVAAEYGMPTRLPVYSTEYGYKTNPPYSGGAPLGLAAAYLNRAEYMSWRNPRIRSWDQYLLVDPGNGAHSKFVTALEFADAVPKPSFYAYRMPIYLPVTAERGGSGLEVWGCVRPAYHETRPSEAEIQLQAGGAGAFKTVRAVPLAGSACYFDTTARFPSGGNVRVAWSYPDGPTIYSRLVAVTVG